MRNEVWVEPLYSAAKMKGAATVFWIMKEQLGMEEMTYKTDLQNKKTMYGLVNHFLDNAGSYKYGEKLLQL